MEIEVVEVHRPSRRLMWGRRPLPDETLGHYIERVIMRLPERQRPVLFRAEPPIWLGSFEPSYVTSPAWKKKQGET